MRKIFLDDIVRVIKEFGEEPFFVSSGECYNMDLEFKFGDTCILDYLNLRPSKQDPV